MRAAGIYEDIDIEVYHSEAGLSSTGVSLILDCPKKYWYSYLSLSVDPVQYEKTSLDSYSVGTETHSLVFEPEKFYRNNYLMTEHVNLATTDGKKKYAQAQELAMGKKVIRAKDAEDILMMAQNISFKEYGPGKVEHSIYWDNPILDVRFRARPDFYNDDYIIDLKTTDSIARFPYSIYKYGYHRQASLQIDGLSIFDDKPRKFLFYVVEKKAPYLTRTFVLSEEAIEKGRQECIEAATIYNECINSDVWPGYDKTPVLVNLPRYLEKEEDLING